MGIRVHKVLGYGLSDVKTRKWKIADGRINAASPLLNWDSDAKLDDYLDWLKVEHKTDEDKMIHFNMDMMFFRDREEEGFDWRKRTGVSQPAELVHHGTEYMEKNVLLIRPLSCKDWQRYDDPIDYVEETHKYADEDGVINWYRLIPGGIFPYNGTFMNARTGERVSDGITLWRILTWDGWDKMYDLEKAAVKCGFDSAEDVRENLVPVVPEDIRDLVRWGKLFTDEDVWKQLRPMIYTYWS